MSQDGNIILTHWCLPDPVVLRPGEAMLKRLHAIYDGHCVGLWPPSWFNLEVQRLALMQELAEVGR